MQDSSPDYGTAFGGRKHFWRQYRRAVEEAIAPALAAVGQLAPADERENSEIVELKNI